MDGRVNKWRRQMGGRWVAFYGTEGVVGAPSRAVLVKRMRGERVDRIAKLDWHGRIERAEQWPPSGGVS